MTRRPPQSLEFDAILDEHRHLRDLVRLIQLGVLHPRPTAGVVRRLLDELDVALRSHFEHEERDGYLHDALSAEPRLSCLANRLFQEHADFLAAMDALRQLGARASETGDWAEFAGAYAGFCRRFDEHETAENRLVQDAMNRDMQAED